MSNKKELRSYLETLLTPERIKDIGIGGAGALGAYVGSSAYDTAKELYPGFKEKIFPKLKQDVKKRVEQKKKALRKKIKESTGTAMGKAFAVGVGASVIKDVVDDLVRKGQHKTAKKIAKKLNLPIEDKN